MNFSVQAIAKNSYIAHYDTSVQAKIDQNSKCERACLVQYNILFRE